MEERRLLMNTASDYPVHVLYDTPRMVDGNREIGMQQPLSKITYTFNGLMYNELTSRLQNEYAGKALSILYVIRNFVGREDLIQSNIIGFTYQSGQTYLASYTGSTIALPSNTENIKVEAIKETNTINYYLNDVSVGSENVSNKNEIYIFLPDSFAAMTIGGSASQIVDWFPFTSVDVTFE